MQKPKNTEYQVAYQRYYDIVGEGSFDDLLEENKQETISTFSNVIQQKHDYRYAPNKWTVKELLMHLIDTERVYALRVLMAARGDSNSLMQRMDEDLYAGNVDVSNRPLSDIIHEFDLVRSSTQILCKYITEEQSKNWCDIVPQRMTARAIGYFIIGHVSHHLNVLHERYL